MPTCPICGGESVIPFDTGKKAHHTRPCPRIVGCNGVGQVSEFKLNWIKENTVNGWIDCPDCKGRHKVTCEVNDKELECKIEEGD